MSGFTATARRQRHALRWTCLVWASLIASHPAHAGQLIDIQFVERGSETFDWGNASPGRSFIAEASRFIYVIAVLERSPRTSAPEVSGTCSVIAPDDELLGSGDFSPTSTDATWERWRSVVLRIGSPTAGGWVIGSFRAVCTLGGTRIERTFTMNGALKLMYTLAPGVVLRSVAASEEGTADVAWSDRSIGLSFEASSARFMATYLEIVETGDATVGDVQVVCKYLMPSSGVNGEISGTIALTKKAWTGWVRLNGFGWRDPGQWKAGTLTVACAKSGSSATFEFQVSLHD